MSLTVLLNGQGNLNPKLREALMTVKNVGNGLLTARKELKSLEGQSKNIDLFRKAVADIGEVKTQLAQARVEATALGQALGKGEGKANEAKIADMKKRIDDKKAALRGKKDKSELEPLKAELAALKKSLMTTKQLEYAFGRAKSQARSLESAYQKLGAEQNRLRHDLKIGGIDTSSLNAGRQKIKAEIDQITRQMERIQRIDALKAKFQGLQSKVAPFAAAGVGMVAAGSMAARGGKTMVEAFVEAEDASTRLKSAMMKKGGVIPPEFEKINELATKLGNRLPGTTADFQDLMTALTQQGISSSSILGGTGEAAAYLSVQLKMLPKDAGEFAAKLQDATRSTESEMMGVMDVIQRMHGVGLTPVKMLEGFASIGSSLDVLKLKGVEGAKTLAPLLAMADQGGMDAGAAGNAFTKIVRAGLLKLDKAKDYGLDFTNGKGNYGGFDKIFTEIAKMKNWNDVKRVTAIKRIFGQDKEVMQLLDIIREKGREGYDAMSLGKLQGQASLTEKVGGTLGTLSNMWDAASGTFRNLLARWAGLVEPELKSLTDLFGKISEKVDNWVKDNPKLARSLAVVAAVGIGLMFVLGGLFLAAAALIAPLGFLTTASAGLSTGFLATALSGAKLLGVFGLLAVAAYMIYDNWGGILGGLKAMWDRLVVDPVMAGWDAIESSITTAWSRLSSAFATLWQNIKTAWANNDWLALGAAILKGIGLGMLSQAELVLAPIKAIAAGAAGYWKNMFNIKDGPEIDPLAPTQIIRRPPPLAKTIAAGLAATQFATAAPPVLPPPSPQAAQIAAAPKLLPPLNVTANILPTLPRAAQITDAPKLLLPQLQPTAVSPLAAALPSQPLTFKEIKPIQPAAGRANITDQSSHVYNISIAAPPPGSPSSPEDMASAIRKALEKRDAERSLAQRSRLYD